MPLTPRRLPAAVISVGLATALVGVVAVLGGCDSQETPVPTASASASATSAAPSPSTTAPSPSTSATVEIPAAAREKSDKGAEAFVRFFMQQAAKAWTEPNARLIEAHATDNCGACRDLADVARSLEAEGQRYDGPPVSVVGLRLLRSNESGVAFDAKLSENKVNVVSDAGSLVDSYPKRRITRAIAVEWGEGRWRLDGIGE